MDGPDFSLGGPGRRNQSPLRGRSREQEVLNRLCADVRSGRSRVLVVRGEAGIGKTALLEYLVERSAGCAVARAIGVHAEMEVPFAGLQQLLGSRLGPLERLPDLHREAIEVAFALRSGPPPNRFLLGVAVLGLLAELADEGPLVCVVDNAQWLDRSSAQTLGFVARRLLGEAVGLVLAVREPSDERTFDGLPELVPDRLGREDARELLAGVIAAPVDDVVLDRLVDESRGNPLALMELPQGLSRAQLAGGFGLPSAWSLSRRLEESFLRRLAALPEGTQRLLLLAAAEPLGDPTLLLRAAERLGLDVEAAAPAEAAGLLELGAPVRFRHTLVRTAVYRAAPLADRRAAHRALAAATDARTDPDRHAWHRAQAALGPDEDVASELERSAERAQARGGLAAAAAFLEHAAALTPDPGRRAQRALAAARDHHLAGAPEAAMRLLDAAAAGPLCERDYGLAQHLRGRIALHLNRSGEAVALLIDAAKRLESHDPRRARGAHLEALYAASVAGRLGPGIEEAAASARAAPSPLAPPQAVDLLLDGLAVRFTDGYGASAPTLERALAALDAERPGLDENTRLPWLGPRVAADLFDDESWHSQTFGGVRLVRDIGALGVMPIVLTYLADLQVLEGKLDAAEALAEEAQSMIEATGSRRITGSKLLLTACRGSAARAEQLIAQAERDATARGEGVVLTYAEHARAVLGNGLGHYQAALAAAQQASAQDELGVSTRSLAELVEAAARSGSLDVAAEALQRLRVRTRAAGSEWALGTEARSRALLSAGEVAERFYREAIERLSASRVAFELARAHLLYGEWLRREKRRVDAREQLRKAQEMFAAMGAGPFAERAGRELLATGETARKRTVETTDDLTPHELRIARMARDGASNEEIATELFVSRKTVEYHLHKVFLKLGISRREHLYRVVPRDGPETMTPAHD
ncbi:MAG TPA: AAA family ATPase [Thermoleophilaceae bacterium]|nr:AAA family ATPase [Thermoleophilaceae bacterium]